MSNETMFRVYEDGTVVHQDDCADIDARVDAGYEHESPFIVHIVPDAVIDYLLPPIEVNHEVKQRKDVVVPAFGVPYGYNKQK